MAKRKPEPDPLSRRERQIMDIVYRRGEATIRDVLTDLADPPSYSAVRALMRVLEDKGHLQHAEDGPTYVYRPTVDPDKVRRSALWHVVHTFFGGNASEAAAALLDLEGKPLSRGELDQLEAKIVEARKEGR
jgi:predicted transcriptional regulator